MTGLVVITRPPDEARALASDLNALGYETLVAPMLRIAPRATSLPSPANYAALAFTSANGVRVFAQNSAERTLPAYAVGGATAEALREAGFADVRGAAGDAVALARLIQGTLGGSGPVLHVSGKDVARDIAALLAPAGIAVDRVIAYEAVAATALPTGLVEALYARTVIHVLFFSVRTAVTFGTLIREHGLTHMVSSSSALCLSHPIATEAGGLPWRKVEIATTPTLDALISLLPPAGTIDAV